MTDLHRTIISACREVAGQIEERDPEMARYAWRKLRHVDENSPTATLMQVAEDIRLIAEQVYTYTKEATR